MNVLDYLKEYRKKNLAMARRRDSSNNAIFRVAGVYKSLIDDSPQGMEKFVGADTPLKPKTLSRQGKRLLKIIDKLKIRKEKVCKRIKEKGLRHSRKKCK